MPLLRLTQSNLDDDRYRLEIDLQDGGPRRVIRADVTFRLTARDEEDLRWYLEEHLQWPHEPAPTIATMGEPNVAVRPDRWIGRPHRATAFLGQYFDGRLIGQLASRRFRSVRASPG